jgi:zona occludens toxin (predicted ATPase)
MIVVYEGIPGSAKTYSAVKKIAEMLRQGRVVYTNIDGLNGDQVGSERHCEALRLYSGLSEQSFQDRFRPLTKDQAARFWEIVKDGALIVLDEVHKLWSNREWQTTGNKAFGDWCSTHRHEGFDLILISQNISKIDGHVRTNVEWTYRFKKINYFGSLVQNSFTVSVFFECEVDADPFKRTREAFDRKIFRCYRSYVGKDVKEQGIGTSHNVLNKPIFWVIPVVFCFALYMLIFRSGFLHGEFFGIIGAKRANAAPVKPVPLPAAASQGTPSQPVNLDPGRGYYLNGKWVADDKVKSPVVPARSDSPARTAAIGGRGDPPAQVEENPESVQGDEKSPSKQAPYVWHPNAKVEAAGNVWTFWDWSGREVGHVKFVGESRKEVARAARDYR